MSEVERGRGGTGEAADPLASASPAERLDELAALLTRRFSGVYARRPGGGSVLYLIRSGAGPRYVLWSRSRSAYVWYGEPDHGEQVGATAEQAAEVIGAALNLPRA
ncbi:hypothetical protein [Actinomadura roseirufa]|uniref:hypothetical protein n=1 Tax=Actinomadura roseirufa TaxID=2094049 RepID=UPI001041354F|nr:hypothetical protein [Actinomadura roseirufa]